MYKTKKPRYKGKKTSKLSQINYNLSNETTNERNKQRLQVESRKMISNGFDYAQTIKVIVLGRRLWEKTRLKKPQLR